MKDKYGRDASDTITFCGCMTATELPVTVRNQSKAWDLRDDGHTPVPATPRAAVTRTQTNTTHPILCYIRVPAVRF